MDYRCEDECCPDDWAMEIIFNVPAPYERRPHDGRLTAKPVEKRIMEKYTIMLLFGPPDALQ
jgi:hypothetical protein